MNLKTTLIRRFYPIITPRITRIIRVFPAGFLVIPALLTPDSGDILRIIAGITLIFLSFILSNLLIGDLILMKIRLYYKICTRFTLIIDLFSNLRMIFEISAFACKKYIIFFN